MKPQDYLQVICDARPCPVVSGYERAFWFYECREAVRWIAGYADAEFRRQVGAIGEAGLRSDTYEIVPIERAESRVCVSRLREKEPAVFSELVHIRASDAQKILGRRRLYEMAKEAIGSGIEEYEVVTVGDLEKVMFAGRAAQYIEAGSKVVDWAVLEVQR